MLRLMFLIMEASGKVLGLVGFLQITPRLPLTVSI
jgi:hypothetical protein